MSADLVAGRGQPVHLGPGEVVRARVGQPRADVEGPGHSSGPEHPGHRHVAGLPIVEGQTDHGVPVGPPCRSGVDRTRSQRQSEARHHCPHDPRRPALEPRRPTIRTVRSQLPPSLNVHDPVGPPSSAAGLLPSACARESSRDDHASCARRWRPMRWPEYLTSTKETRADRRSRVERGTYPKQLAAGGDGHVCRPSDRLMER